MVATVQVDRAIRAFCCPTNKKGILDSDKKVCCKASLYTIALDQFEKDILTEKKRRIRFIYRVFFLTVPPNFQYQNEKQWAANQRFCSMKFSMYKRSSLVEQRFSF